MDKNVKNRLEKIITIALYVIIAALMLDFFIRCNIYKVIDEERYTQWKMNILMIEFIAAFVIFFIMLFVKSWYGELMGSKELNAKFPLLKYFIISASVSILIQVGFYMVKFILSSHHNEYGFHIIFILGFFIGLPLVIVCGILLLAFYIAYKIAIKRKSKKEIVNL